LTLKLPCLFDGENLTFTHLKTEVEMPKAFKIEILNAIGRLIRGEAQSATISMHFQRDVTARAPP